MEQSDVITSQDLPRTRRRLPLALRIVRRYSLWVFLFLVIVCSGAAFAYGRYTVYEAHPELSGQEQATAILQKVGELIQLPQGGTPTMATITNASAVKSEQPFLANAENGDVLIVYTNAQTAMLYRPSTNKLIAVGPVTSQATSEETQKASTPVAPSGSSKTSTSSSSNASSSKSTK